MNLYAQRVGMSVAIVCMVNHTAVLMMRDATEQVITRIEFYLATVISLFICSLFIMYFLYFFCFP